MALDGDSDALNHILWRETATLECTCTTWPIFDSVWAFSIYFRLSKGRCFEYILRGTDGTNGSCSRSMKVIINPLWSEMFGMELTSRRRGSGSCFKSNAHQKYMGFTTTGDWTLDAVFWFSFWPECFSVPEVYGEETECSSKSQRARRFVVFTSCKLLPDRFRQEYG